MEKDEIFNCEIKLVSVNSLTIRSLSFSYLGDIGKDCG